MKNFIGQTKYKYGQMNYCHFDEYVGLSIREYGEFSEIELSIMNKFIKKGDVIFDVGANIGAFTIPFSNKVGQKGEIYCFEPQEFIFNLLQTNINHNNLKNVKPLNYALGKKHEKIILKPIDYSSVGNFGGVGLRYDNSKIVKELTNKVKQRVEIKPLDNFISVPRCNFLKVDVENMEIEVLEGGINFIKKHQPIMWLENHLYYPNHLNEYLSKIDYDAYWCNTRIFNPENYFVNDKNYFDEIVTVNTLAIPKSKKNEYNTQWLEKGELEPKIVHTKVL